MRSFDTIIIGAGAAGLMCAAGAYRRGRRVLLLEKSPNVGQKIRISGGGHANFTNIHASPANFLSENPRFCVSALARYTQHDFIALVERHGIAYQERDHGQLFCDGSAQQIIDMLLAEALGVDIQTATAVTRIEKKTIHSPSPRIAIPTPRHRSSSRPAAPRSQRWVPAVLPMGSPTNSD